MIEGPGTIGDYLQRLKLPSHTVDLSKGEPIPELEQFSHLLIMGGPMAVYEMERFPFLKEEADLIERALRADKPILGICLGSQMIAHVLGAKVYPGAEKEIGWYKIALTEDAMGDSVMSELAVENKKAIVFQWHGDTFDLPSGAVRLASSELYPHQAFKFSASVYALQFHIEVTPAILRQWFGNEKDMDVAKILSETDAVVVPYHRRAENFYSKFFASGHTKRA